MSDETFIRRTKLRKLGKTAKELAQLGIGGYSYWAAMLAENSVKNFGEKAARQLEEKLDLPRGWLDQPLLNQGDAQLVAPTITLSASGVPDYARQISILFNGLPVEVRLEAFNAVIPILLAFLPAQTESKNTSLLQSDAVDKQTV